MALTKVDLQLITGFEPSSSSMIQSTNNIRYNVPTISTITNAGGTINLDFNVQNIYSVTGFSTWTARLLNIANQQSVYIIIASSGASQTVTWTSDTGITIRWNNNTIPTITQTASRKDLITFIRVNNELFGSYMLNT
jgi:hypothetical protein